MSDRAPRRIAFLNRAKHLLKPNEASEQLRSKSDFTQKAAF